MHLQSFFTHWLCKADMYTPLKDNFVMQFVRSKGNDIFEAVMHLTKQVCILVSFVETYCDEILVSPGLHAVHKFEFTETLLLILTWCIQAA
jgi:hypothetical protein